MEIQVIIQRRENNGNRKRGVASVVIDNAIRINDIRIIEGDNGLFMAMPSRRKPDGKFKDIVHPINQEVRTLIEKAILDEYHRLEETEEKEEE